MAQDSQSRILHEGIIYKKGQINKAWKERHFVLYNSRRLSYFENSSSTSGAPIKTIDLSDVHSINIIPTTNNNNKNSNKNKNNNKSDEYNESKLQRMETISVASVTDREYSFELLTAKRTYLLSCLNSSSLQSWVSHLEKSIFGGRLYQGWLIKRGAYRKSWKKRWFVIYDTQEMRYYDNKNRCNPKGLIKLYEVLLMCPGDSDQYSQPYTIQLMTPDRNWVLATVSQKERDEWFSRLEETIHGAKRLITSYEGYLWKKGQVVKSWKKRYFALSKGWLFYFEQQFHCNKFKSIAFFSEAFFNQAFRLYVKGSIPLHQTTVQKINKNSNDSNNETDEKEFVFKIITQKRQFIFATENKNELNKWFKAFHYTHNGNNNNSNENNNFDEESELTMTNDNENNNNEIDDVYSQIMNDENDYENDEEEEEEVQVQEEKEKDNNEQEEKDNNNKGGHKYGKSQSQTPLMDIIDPNGTAKWIDIEDETVEQKQLNVLKKRESIQKNNDQQNE